MTQDSIRHKLFMFVVFVIGVFVGLAIAARSSVADMQKRTSHGGSYNYAIATHDLERGQTVKRGDVAGAIMESPCGYDDVLMAEESESVFGGKLLVPLKKGEPVLRRYLEPK